VREDELEPDEERTGERRHLERRAPPRPPVERDRAEHERGLEHVLHEMQVREPFRVVLPPVPERER